MKLVFLTVSLIAAFAVDCRSQPEPDSLHSDIAEQLQWPDSKDGDSDDTTSMPTLPHVVPDRNLGLDDSEDEDPEERSLDTDIPTPLMPDLTIGDDEFDVEEDEQQSVIESRGSKCKSKALCNVAGGKCIPSSAYCYGRRDHDLCKGSCICCIRECPYDFFSPPGSKQCFKINTTSANWTNAAAACKAHDPPLQLAHPDDAISLRSYMIQRFGDNYHYWLNARGGGSYMYWQDNRQLITKYSPLWANGQPYNTSSSYCLLFLTKEDWWAQKSNGTYYTYPCYQSWLLPLCELKLYN